jgi:hypothetical protein
VKGLGADPGECIRLYKELALEADIGQVKGFLDRLIGERKNKYLLFIITSTRARIADNNRELEILDYLYRSSRMATHLRIYANTRCCYKVCNKNDRSLAKLYIQRGYESLHIRQACSPSDRSKMDPTHIGFSVMLAMLNVYVVHGWLGQAHSFAAASCEEASRVQYDYTTNAFYGTATRIAKIAGIYYFLDYRNGQSVDVADKCLELMRNVFSCGFKKADSNMTRYSEFLHSMSVYQCILESMKKAQDIESTTKHLVDLCILSNQKSKHRVLRKLGFAQSDAA